jgi:hypothetical protein
LFADGERAPDVKVIEYSGTYREGSAGRDDALFMLATIAAAQAAWFTAGLVIDLRQLAYSWGDEMEWLTNSGGPAVRASVIVPGPACRAALGSLLEEDFDKCCMDSFDEAVRAVRLRVAESRRRASNESDV